MAKPLWQPPADAEQTTNMGRFVRHVSDAEGGSVQTYEAGPPMPMRREAVMMAADAAAGSVAPSYQSGDLSFRVSVSATFALE